ncbi:MAG TPA: metallophosphoesterase family protein [Gemmataceae bacterium]|jgi:serine/threonine protein phosphatase 1|nr:metallophosphoesterase family protein [Gemmataceae bacterium]
MPRTLAIGDVHGCLMALDTLLGFVQPAADDTLIFLGDYVDRGPDSKGVLDRLIELHAAGNVVCLRGNHEVMMLGALGGRDDYLFWLRVGGMEAMDSYRTEGSDVTLDDIPHEHWVFLRQTIMDFHETETHVYVHANLHPDLSPADQPTDWLHWQAIAREWHRPHGSGKTMICGHTHQKSGLPLVLERAVCIDTWAYGDGWLTCLDVGSGEYWQATDLGETRSGRLDKSHGRSR